MFHGEALADCVIRGKRDCYICVFEKFGDEPGFFPTYVNLAHLRFWVCVLWFFFFLVFQCSGEGVILVIDQDLPHGFFFFCSRV